MMVCTLVRAHMAAIVHNLVCKEWVSVHKSLLACIQVYTPASMDKNKLVLVRNLV